MRFSIAMGTSGDWDDEFLRLVGPEIARYNVRRAVPVDWIREFARGLSGGENATQPSVLLSNHVLVPLPTAASAASASSAAAR